MNAADWKQPTENRDKFKVEARKTYAPARSKKADGQPKSELLKAVKKKMNSGTKLTKGLVWEMAKELVGHDHALAASKFPDGVRVWVLENAEKGSKKSHRASNGFNENKFRKKAYFTVMIPPAKGKPTQWHDRSKTLQRGAFDTKAEADKWAKKNLKGEGYSVKEFKEKSAMDQLAVMELNFIEGSLKGVPLERSLRALEAAVRDDSISRSEVQLRMASPSFAGDGIRWRTRFFKMFFPEKRLPLVYWNLRDNEGTNHSISNQVVLEFVAQAPSNEQRGIEGMIRKIDFANGDVNDYLKHLAGALINNPDFAMRVGAEEISRMVPGAARTALEELMSLSATFNEGSRIPDGWDSGYIEDDPDATESDEGSEIPDGSGNMGKRAAVDDAVGELKSKTAASIELWVAVTSDGKFLGAQDRDVFKDKSKWSGVKRTKGRDFTVQRATGVPMGVAERMLDWGSDNPKTNYWKDEATANQNVKRYIAKGKQADVRPPGGLYGYTKKVQADCEVSVRKVQRDASRIARAIYGKNPKVAAFLATHAKRANSLPAKILMASMEGMGPKFASDMNRTARLAELREARGIEAATPLKKGDTAVYTSKGGRANTVEIMSNESGGNVTIKGKGGATKKVSVSELTSINRKTAAPRGKAQEAIASIVNNWDKGQSQNLSELSQNKAFIGAHFARIMSAAEALKKSGLIDFDGVKITKKAKVSDADSQGEGIKQTTDKEARVRGLYGYNDKVASLGLSACSEMRGCAGRIAFNLHRRRQAKHGAITAFFDTHCKTAKCMHSRLLSASYPSADTRVAALQPPQTAVGWLAWED